MSTGSKRSVEDLAKAFESILESVIEETGLGTSNGKISLTQNQFHVIENLYDIVNSGDLRRATETSASTSETIACCDGFISEWKRSGTKSAAVQQLIALLNRPHIRGLLWSTEDVSARRFAPELPPIPFEVDEDEGIAVKIVRIVRRDEPLGATIKCDHGKVYVARIMAGGVAEGSGCIQEGDRVLEVNGETVSDKRPDEIVRLLNTSDKGTVTFKLIPAEVLHHRSSARESERSHIHLRAMFDYEAQKDARHPCPEAALSFRRGDILELLVCNDEHWWQARRLGNGSLAHARDDDKKRHNDSSGSTKGGVGLIPSELLQQKTWKSGTEDEKEKIPNGTTSTGTMGKAKAASETKHEELYYESVCRHRKSNITRPVVLIGPPGVGRNELKRRLLMLFPERFSTTVPHTTRTPRPGEVEGADYYFTQRSTMEKMIEDDEMLEFGEFRGNLYGTSISAVRVAREKSTPLLTPHPLALRHLRTPEFVPIIIFVQPPPFHDFKETREALRARMTRTPSAASSSVASSQQVSVMGRGFTDSEIRQVIDNATAIDKMYGHMFDARLVNANLEDSIAQLVKLLHHLESRPTWVPLSWATRAMD